MLLSTKHRDATTARAIPFPEIAKDWFILRKDNSIFVRSRCKTLDNISVRISLDAMRTLGDLEEDFKEAVEAFSTITEIAIVNMDNDNVLAEMPLSSKTTMVYLSHETLELLSKTELHTDDEYLYLPIRLLSPKKPFLQALIMSDDMTAAVGEIVGYLKTKSGLESTKSYSEALQKFSSMIHSKAVVNIFYLQVILRAFAIDPNGDHAIPIVADLENMRFGRADTALKQRSHVLKILYESIPAWLSRGTTFIEQLATTELDFMFGLGTARFKITGNE